MRSLWLLSAAGVGLTIASCSVYSMDLLGLGGSTGTGAATSPSSTGGANGGGATSSTTTSSTSTTSSTTTSSTSTTSSSGGAGPTLWISQLKTRGSNGGNDDWVEIYNPGSAPVTFDSTWALKVRNATLGLSGCATVLYATRFNGGGQIIPPHGHILYANSAGFSESATTMADGTYSSMLGIPDAASVILVRGNTLVDALCCYYDAATESTLACSGNAFTCSGTPVQNPHDNTTGTNDNASLERRPGGAGGNTMNTQDNAADFVSRTTADPHDLASTPVP